MDLDWIRQKVKENQYLWTLHADEERRNDGLEIAEITDGKESKMNVYGDCTYCGGEVSEKKERIDYRYHGQLFIIENVPVGICRQCGEKFFTATVAKQLEKSATSTHASIKTVAVPVIPLAA